MLLHLLTKYILDPDLNQEARFDQKPLKCGSKRGDGSSEDIIERKISTLIFFLPKSTL